MFQSTLKRFYYVPQFDASLLRLQELEKGSSPNIENKFETYQKRLSIDYSEILHCLDNLGLVCAYLVFFSITLSVLFLLPINHMPVHCLCFSFATSCADLILFILLPSKAAEVCLEKISNTKEESETYKECSMVCKEFLENILSTIGVYLQQGTVSKLYFTLRRSPLLITYSIFFHCASFVFINRR